MLRTVLLLATLALTSWTCSDDVKGKPNGEPCIAHEDCASKLCTIPTTPREAGVTDGGTGKICTEPGLTP